MSKLKGEMNAEVDDIKSRVDGFNMDLSLSTLSVVPLSQIAPFGQITNLDLSCNNLIELPAEFCVQLRRLRQLDLSKNKIMTLPDNFGEMVNLIHLDFYKNNIHSLPISFCYLKKLKWLDLKDNPLDDKLRLAAGDCLNDTQCKHCATQVLRYMAEVYTEREHNRQEMLRRQREREAHQAKEEELRKEAERRRHLAHRKAEKEKRQKAFEEKRLKELEEENLRLRQQLQSSQESSRENSSIASSSHGASGLSGVFIGAGTIFRILCLTIFFVALLMGIELHCQDRREDPVCKKLASYSWFKQFHTITVLAQFYFEKAWQSVILAYDEVVTLYLDRTAR